ncbi:MULTISPECIES: OsmC family protein [unclassified Myroides]|uniref:OsmC family protein n=1 Tax=unclassified Myroides TaxID=2642485 RepID=UPI0015FBC0BC|nr:MULTISPECIES: OsmC family protein [unclassified Myroides]MBB1150576.1 OsmC family protein [Myroides sp. NP-2]MDM1407193.1 OsmC family protein [Myroides sp. DF42-4-2]
MSNKVVKVLGFSVRESQLAIKTANFSFTVKDGKELVKEAQVNSEELILAKLAGSIHAIGNLIGLTLNVDLKSIQIEVSGVVDEALQQQHLDAGVFKKIEVVVKPTSTASIVLLKEWIDAVKLACPVFANFKQQTPTIVTLVKEYDHVNVA